MQEYHATMMRKWAENIEKLGFENQALWVLKLPLPREKIPELQEKIRQFQDEIIGWSQDFSNCDDLIQLGTYLSCTIGWGEVRENLKFSIWKLISIKSIIVYK